MPFTKKNFEICGHYFDPETFEGMTRFPSFFEPFLKIGGNRQRPKCTGERVAIPNAEYALTEKVDGVNGQIIGWLDKNKEPHVVIRGRNELLAYSKDWIWNDKEGMVTTLLPHIQNIEEKMNEMFPHDLWILGVELYGPGVSTKRADKYSPKKEVRLFSSRIFNETTLKLFKETPREQYDSIRRVNKHAPFLPFDIVQEIASDCSLKTVPFFGEIKGEAIQKPSDAMYLLQDFKSSKTAEEDGGSVNCEGLVMWSQADYFHPDQGEVMAVFKIKHEDYPEQ
jgi:hypothetical protein